MKRIVKIFFASLIATTPRAQDSTDVIKKFEINGYIKNLQTLSFTNNFEDLTSGNLIHNRLNTRWRPWDKITVAAEFRNRLFWGEEVKQNPAFESSLRNKNEKVNLQRTWISTKSLVLHTNTERAYINYDDEELKIRIGRQRINWGVATTWNPNDIFNVYNFLDFDYEERPGVDGGDLKYVFSNSFTTEVGYANTGKRKGTIVALKYSLNKWNYDMQLITGWYKDRPTIGTGWAGNIKDAGFKGEVQYFLGDKDSTRSLNISLEGDYMFKNGWYLNAGILFNSIGLYKSVNTWKDIDLNLSSTNLMPTKWNTIITTSKELTPLLSANVSAVYAPGTNLFIVFPSIRYSMATNLDINLVWQSFFIELNNSFQSVNHRCLLRVKWSF